MNHHKDSDPKQFLLDFYAAFNRDLIDTDEDLAAVVDRYHTLDLVQTTDGRSMDRDKLIAHVRPIRKNKPSVRTEMHDAVATDDRIAARYTMHVVNRKRMLVMEVCTFARFTADGRMRESHGLTRTVANELVEQVNPA